GEECAQLLSQFFKMRRAEKKQLKQQQRLITQGLIIQEKAK
ncbi:tRNA adenosine(34) deaminase TadA, partial [Klebsiella oxytoca]